MMVMINRPWALLVSAHVSRRDRKVAPVLPTMSRMLGWLATKEIGQR
jgi:hypothetical protein